MAPVAEHRTTTRHPSRPEKARLMLLRLHGVAWVVLLPARGKGRSLLLQRRT